MFTCRDGKGGKLSSQASKMLHKPPGEQGRLLSAHAWESKKTLLLCLFCECIAGCAVFGPVEFNNRTFEGESFFNKSSVSHLNHVTGKSNSK